MEFFLLSFVSCLASVALSQTSNAVQDIGSSTTVQGTYTPTYIPPPSGSYISYTGQSTIATTSACSESGCTSASKVASQTNAVSTTNTLLLEGSHSPTSLAPSGSSSSATASSSPAASAPVNTQPCNNYVEFCDRRYMNVTEVAAHNAPFTTPNNAARNQDVVILGQLNDGIRMLTSETQHVNDTIYMCHTSCDLLNAGTLESQLTTIREWVAEHPYDVVTILLVNTGYVDVNLYTTPIMNSGLMRFLYEPPKIPMHKDDWPTYGEMILSGKRVVIFMDYEANQTAVPYILDEFSQMWETPFSPTDINFPCDQQRPPGLNEEQQDLIPYLANHNLNVGFNFGSTEILIPNFAALDLVNANNESTGSLLSMAQGCKAQWGRPPAWLLVDFYDVGDGSVFEVAAQMNNVTYNRNCCGERVGVSAASGHLGPSVRLALAAYIGLAIFHL